jgi:hypothetical protein
MIKLLIEPAMIDERVDHIIHWTMGWLYRHGYAFSAEEYDYRDGWSVDIHTRGLEPVTDVFEFVLDGFGDAFRYFVDEIDAEVEVIAVCNEKEGECFGVWLSDLKKLEDQEHLEIEERWQRMIEPMIYGEDDDPEYREYEEAVRFERMMGIRNDGDMVDAVFERVEYE